jgi:hypothetical protein
MELVPVINQMTRQYFLEDFWGAEGPTQDEPSLFGDIDQTYLCTLGWITLWSHHVQPR